MKEKEKDKYLEKLKKDLVKKYILTADRDLLEPKQFINFYEDDSEVHLMALYKVAKQLGEHYDTAVYLQTPDPVEKTPQDTLKEYVNRIDAVQSDIGCCKVINNAGHGRMLRSVFRRLFDRGNDEKMCVSQFIGPRNSGKSQFLRRLGEIFAGDEVDWRGKYLCVARTNQKNVKPQMITCEEFNKSHAFNRENIGTTKRLFEGEGAPVQSNLYKSHVAKYEKVIFALASNTYPSFEGTGYSESEFETDVLEPMRSRIDFVYLFKRHNA